MQIGAWAILIPTSITWYNTSRRIIRIMNGMVRTSSQSIQLSMDKTVTWQNNNHNVHISNHSFQPILTVCYAFSSFGWCCLQNNHPPNVSGGIGLLYLVYLIKDLVAGHVAWPLCGIYKVMYNVYYHYTWKRTSKAKTNPNCTYRMPGLSRRACYQAWLHSKNFTRCTPSIGST